jgi:hypothetical protein
MVHKQNIELQVHTRAKTNAVHALLRDGASWLAWMSIDSCDVERTGGREPEGVDAIAYGLAAYPRTARVRER